MAKIYDQHPLDAQLPGKGFNACVQSSRFLSQEPTLTTDCENAFVTDIQINVQRATGSAHSCLCIHTIAQLS